MKMSEYRLAIDNKSIVWGQNFDIEPFLRKKSSIDTVRWLESGRFDWNLPSGVYRAKDIVLELDKLLEAILVQLGEAARSDTLFDNLQANLAISGRESVLPLGPLGFEDKAGAELTVQAKNIGEQLTNWAREINSQKRAFKQYGESTLNGLKFRSYCEHHLVTPQTVAMIFGPKGSPDVMLLFNEYLHQFVLLRDALLPFQNWEEVPIEIKEIQNSKGLRFLERARTEFLTDLLARRMSHKAIVKFTQGVLSPDLSTVGYGFQYRLGTILPASLGKSVAEAPRYLLHWYPVQTVLSGTSGEIVPVAFDYEFQDYYAAPRTQAGPDEIGSKLDPLTVKQEDVHEVKIITASIDSDRVLLQFSLQMESSAYVVDLGQAFRGHRFMYRPEKDSGTDPGTDRVNPSSIHEQYAGNLLDLPGLVTKDSGIQFISSGGNILVIWALLGKLYPENVVLLDSTGEKDLERAINSGIGYGAKFIIG